MRRTSLAWLCGISLLSSCGNRATVAGGSSVRDQGSLRDAVVGPVPDGGALTQEDAAPSQEDAAPSQEDAAPLQDAAPFDVALPLDGAAFDLAEKDLASRDLASTPHADLAGVDAGPRTMGQLAGLTTLLAGQSVSDVSTDQGGGIWAVTSSTVYYFPAGRTTPFTYDQSSGLARGQTTWKPDTYYSGQPPGTVTWPVTFSAVAGATSGQAIIGNVGTIADRLEVSPSSGAVLRVDNMAVTSAQCPPDPTECAAQAARVVATHKIVVDLNGTFNGSAYIGGWHGFSVFHGLTRDCGCLAFEEHQHFFPGPPQYPSSCDSTPGDPTCFDGDVRGLAVSATGDIWAGDRHFVQMLPQRSVGASADFFQSFSVGLDVFPGVKDEVAGLAVDAAGGVYVASDGNGMAYLSAPSYAPVYFTTATTLPDSHLRGVVVDKNGEVWIATASQGVVRYQPSTNRWTYYAQSSGLPSPDLNAIYVDPYSSSVRSVLFATDNGIAIYTGP